MGLFGAICAAVTGRSGKWPAARDAHLRAHPACVACGQPADTVHHVEPVHVAPDRELDPENFASVCDRCHFTVGHCNRWASWQTRLWDVVAVMRAGRSAPPREG